MTVVRGYRERNRGGRFQREGRDNRRDGENRRAPGAPKGTFFL